MLQLKLPLASQPPLHQLSKPPHTHTHKLTADCKKWSTRFDYSTRRELPLEPVFQGGKGPKVGVGVRGPAEKQGNCFSHVRHAFSGCFTPVSLLLLPQKYYLTQVPFWCHNRTHARTSGCMTAARGLQHFEFYVGYSRKGVG